MPNPNILNLHRPGAHVELSPDTGALRLTVVSVVEFLAPGRVPSLGVRGDLPLKPGVIYKAFTGVGADFPLPFLGCVVRVDKEGWRYGVEVKRLEYGDQSEMLVFFTVLEPMRLDQTPLIFEVFQTGVIWSQLETQQGQPLSLPGIKIALEPVSNRRLVERAVPAAVPAPANGKQMSEAEAAKRANEWLNSPDEKGRVISGSDQVAAHPVEKPAVVTAAAAPKDMSSNLRRGVVTAPLRAVPSEIAGEGQPPVADLKEEFTVLQPQAEKAADPLASL